MFASSMSSIPSIWQSISNWFTTPAILFLLLNIMIGAILFTSNLSHQKHHHQEHPSPRNYHYPNPTRSPSFLQRVRSINLSPLGFYRKHELKTISQQSQSIEIETREYIFSQHHPEKRPLFYGNSLEKQSPEENTRNIEIAFRSQETHEEEHTDFVSNQSQKQISPENPAHEPNFENGDLPTLDEVYSKLSKLSFSETLTKPAASDSPSIRKSSSMKSDCFEQIEEVEIVEARRPATVRERKSRANEAEEEVDSKADDFISKFRQQLQLQRLDSLMKYKEMFGRGGGK